MNKVINLKQSLFDVAFIVLLTYYLFISMSTFDNFFNDTIVIRNIVFLFTVVILAMIFIFSIYSSRDLFMSVILIFFGILITYHIRSESVFMLFLFCVAAKDVDVNITFKRLYRMLIVSTFVIITMSLLGVIENKIDYGSSLWDNRIYIGFKHPNYCGAVFLNIMLLKIIVQNGNFKFKDYIFVVTIELINFWGPKSKTSLILGAIAIIGIIIINYKEGKFIRMLFSKIKYLPIVLCGVTAILVYSFYSGKETALAINILFSTRIEQMVYFWNKYDITLFGQVLENVSSSEANTLWQMHALDNGYLYMILGQGLIFSVLFIYLCIRTIKRLYDDREYIKIFVLGIVFLWGMMETTLFRIEMNSILLLLTYGIFLRKS